MTSPFFNNIVAELVIDILEIIDCSPDSPLFLKSIYCQEEVGMNDYDIPYQGGLNVL